MLPHQIQPHPPKPSSDELFEVQLGDIRFLPQLYPQHNPQELPCYWGKPGGACEQGCFLATKGYGHSVVVVKKTLDEDGSPIIYFVQVGS